ncbi:type IV pilus modification PilV family protein [Vibrio japonicus]|uniref:Prepilin-type N-terminal cleavage/methylation domain-containing protein n=1 Tax=Vibrio japonicus TaxID=1824638 RepID=A0ABY5LEQ6_9VIBR|nr:prepilin-type N-terminal cleavage/methylation domain-containing protein [Vibrio japonicus]UUM29936.1 prepilin-type N-terminal cleavage/methylation domain-containing protein [Vibrio japonicus]
MICKQKGFSLLEVVIAFLLVGIGVLGLTKLQVHIERQSDYAIESVSALRLAELKLEEFRTRGASSAISLTAITDFDSITSGTKTSGAYTVEWDVEPPTISGSLKSIIVTTSWVDRVGVSQSVQLESMISSHSEFKR